MPDLVASVSSILATSAARWTALARIDPERVVMQAFIPGSGPWRSSFSDHDVDAEG